MEGLKLFWEFSKASALEIMDNKNIYLPAFLALIFLGNVETLYPLLGANEESSGYIILTIVATLLSFVVLSQVVLVQKKKKGGTGELGFFVPTFLLYNLYYSFLFFAGLLLFIVPGLYVLFFFSMVPFIAVLDDEADGKFFKKSRELVRNNLSVVVWGSLINLLLESSAFLFTTVHDPTLKAIINLIYSIPDAFLTLVMTIAMVKVYYHLKSIEQLNPPATENTQLLEN